MSRLSIFPDESAAHAPNGPMPALESNDPAVIQSELSRRGIGFAQWPAEQGLPEGADQAPLLQAYAYAMVDAIRMTPDHPDREPLRRNFLEEHSHAEDEVRFFVEGCGLFVLHIGSEVLSVLCERGDLMRIPAGTRHWFDMGSQPRFCAVRWFNNPEGWVAQYTGSSIAKRFPRLD